MDPPRTGVFFAVCFCPRCWPPFDPSPPLTCLFTRVTLTFLVCVENTALFEVSGSAVSTAFLTLPSCGLPFGGLSLHCLSIRLSRTERVGDDPRDHFFQFTLYYPWLTMSPIGSHPSSQFSFSTRSSISPPDCARPRSGGIVTKSHAVPELPRLGFLLNPAFMINRPPRPPPRLYLIVNLFSPVLLCFDPGRNLGPSVFCRQIDSFSGHLFGEICLRRPDILD